jgi:hypothetical protein
MQAKSAINTHSTHTHRSPSLTHNKNQENSNHFLLLISRTAQSSVGAKKHYVLANSQLGLSSNLNSYSSLTRNLKQKQIEEENSKMLLRIVTAAPTLKRKNWARMQQQHERYK